MPKRILLLGVGNVLLCDEGLGVHALHRIDRDYVLPEYVTLMDGGVMGLDLLQHIGDCTHLLIVDALDAGQTPGTIRRLEGNDIQTSLACKLSIHQVGLQEVLATGKLTGYYPAHLVLWGMQPESLDWGFELTATVASRLNVLVREVLNELRGWGVSLHLKRSPNAVASANLYLPGQITS